MQDTPEKVPADPANQPSKTGGAKKRAPAKAFKGPNRERMQRVAAPARLRRRHVTLMASFVAFVLLPVALSAWYLYTQAADQYVSRVGFTVRTEDVASSSDLLSGFTSLSGGKASDSDILFSYLRSQTLVEDLDARIDLRALFSKPEHDFYFGFDPAGTIEDLTDHWQRMVKVYYDEGSGLMELQVNAFSAEDATLIANELLALSSTLVNDLNAQARADSTRYARDELEKALDRLKESRRSVLAFRNDNQIVDPSADIASQNSLITTLQQQLAESLIEYDLLAASTNRENDPRIQPLRQRIDVIRDRIRQERSKFGAGTDEDGGAFSELISEYEGLSVEREFAEQSYISALAAFDSALAEAGRQSRYLATFIAPTQAERSTHPKRARLLALTAVFALLIWATGTLMYYAVRDRR